MRTITAAEFRRRGAKRNKYNVAPKANRTYDGITFDSKREMRVYQRLLEDRVPGRVILRQVPFRFSGGVTYRADFVVLDCVSTGFYRVTVLDAKGCKTEAYRIKRRLFEASFPWRIEEV